MQKLSLRKFTEVCQTLRESARVYCRRCSAGPAQQDAMLAHESEQFTGRRGEEFPHRTVLQDHPFGVGSRKTQEPALLAQRFDEIQCPENLGFFAAEKVGGVESVAARQARDDVHAAAAQR